MTNAAFHLNLLKPEEHRSSSPIRLRIVLPVLAFFAMVGMGLWWGSIFAQTLIEEARHKETVAANMQKLAAEKEANDLHADYLEKSAQLHQLAGYDAGRRRIGPALAALAANMPLIGNKPAIQLISISIGEPTPQNFSNPNPRLPPLWGPADPVERQRLTIEGRTSKPLYAETLKKILTDHAFSSLVTGEPKETSRTEMSGGVQDAKITTLFTFDYAMPERSFAAEEVKAK